MESGVILILGGARSGKSRYAQKLAEEMGEPVVYIATATAGDEEMAERIARHRASRPTHWLTLEAPLNIGQALEKIIGGVKVVVLDCVTLFLSNLLMEGGESATADQLTARAIGELERVLSLCGAHRVTLIIVSNEVGMGLVPPYPLGRVYRDALGEVNQWLAARADRVILMVAGIPLELKGTSAGVSRL